MQGVDRTPSQKAPCGLRKMGCWCRVRRSQEGGQTAALPGPMVHSSLWRVPHRYVTKKAVPWALTPGRQTDLVRSYNPELNCSRLSRCHEPGLSWDQRLGFLMFLGVAIHPPSQVIHVWWGKVGGLAPQGLSSIVKGLLTPSNQPDLKNITHYLVDPAPANQQVGPGRKEQQNSHYIFGTFDWIVHQSVPLWSLMCRVCVSL